MSENCISCIGNKRTGPDLLCDRCREAQRIVSPENVCSCKCCQKIKAELAPIAALPPYRPSFGKSWTDEVLGLLRVTRVQRDAAERMAFEARNLIGGNGITMIAKERLRQVQSEGWTPEHDDKHDKGELAGAAACYAASASGFDYVENVRCIIPGGKKATMWPWDRKWWKPSTPIRDLEKAGALIAAEIDRLKRLEMSTTKS